MTINWILPIAMPSVMPIAPAFRAYSNPFAMGSLFTMPHMPYFPMPMPILPFVQRVSNFNHLTPKIIINKVRTVGRRIVNTISGGVNSLINNAKKYLGYNEKDGSYKLFTNGRIEAWCADFVSYIARLSGVNLNSRSVEGIRQWGIKHGRHHQSAKVGDAIILKNGMSHTGIVEKIENGYITVIEGNSSNRVQRVRYKENDRRISGFVSIA